MSADSWLFLFAAIGAIGGIAQIVQLYFQIRPLSIPQSVEAVADDTPTAESAMTPVSSGVFVSKKKLVGIGALLLASVLLATIGFWRSLSANARGPKLDEIIATSAVTGWGTDIDPATRRQLDNFGVLGISVISIGPKAKDYKMVLLARAENNLVDPMRDTHVDHSAAFTITQGEHNLQVSLSEATKKQLRVTHVLFLYVVALPNEHPPEDLTSLSSIDPLKAKIMAQQAVAVLP